MAVPVKGSGPSEDSVKVPLQPWLERPLLCTMRTRKGQLRAGGDVIGQSELHRRILAMGPVLTITLTPLFIHPHDTGHHLSFGAESPPASDPGLTSNLTRYRTPLRVTPALTVHRIGNFCPGPGRSFAVWHSGPKSSTFSQQSHFS